MDRRDEKRGDASQGSELDERDLKADDGSLYEDWELRLDRGIPYKVTATPTAGEQTSSAGIQIQILDENDKVIQTSEGTVQQTLVFPNEKDTGRRVLRVRTTGPGVKKVSYALMWKRNDK